LAKQGMKWPDFEENVGRIWTLLANGFGGRIRLPQGRSEEGKQA